MRPDVNGTWFGVRCAAPIGTNEIWYAIWLRWLELGRSRSSGRHFGEVAALARPPRSKKAYSAPCDLRYARAGFGARAASSIKPTTQARDAEREFPRFHSPRWGVGIAFFLCAVNYVSRASAKALFGFF